MEPPPVPMPGASVHVPPPAVAVARPSPPVQVAQAPAPRVLATPAAAEPLRVVDTPMPAVLPPPAPTHQATLPIEVMRTPMTLFTPTTSAPSAATSFTATSTSAATATAPAPAPTPTLSPPPYMIPTVSFDGAKPLPFAPMPKPAVSVFDTVAPPTTLLPAGAKPAFAPSKPKPKPKPAPAVAVVPPLPPPFVPKRPVGPVVIARPAYKAQSKTPPPKKGLRLF